MHRRHTRLVLTLLLIAGSMLALRWFGNWAPAYKPLLPPVYIILIGLAIWYWARWLQPRSNHERRVGDRRHAKRRASGGRPAVSDKQ